jgi:hypothetical protein
MPTMGSANGVGHALEPAVQPLPTTPNDGPALLADNPPDEGLIAGFLLGYRHRTRAAYLADLRDFCTWCTNVGIGLSEVRRIHVEGYVRQLEQAGRSRATLARRLATLAGFYRYAVQEGALPHSPLAHVRRPPVARDSQTLGLDRQEAVRFLAAAEAASARDHALACLLILNGLRVSEACEADVADLGVERAHRVLAVVGARATSARWCHWPHGPSVRSTRRSAAAPTVRCWCPTPGAGWTATMPPGSWRGLPAAAGSPSTSPRTACGTRW